MSSIIFIGTPEKTFKPSLRKLFLIDPYTLLFRIFASFIPPVGNKFRKVYVDFLGPSLALLILSALLNWGYSYKTSKISMDPNEFLLIYFTFVPILCYALGKLGQSSVNFYETISLFGYSLFGHLLTLLVSFITFQEENDAAFFICLIIFSGLSTLRYILVLLKTIPKPAIRLVICSLLGVFNVLSLIFVHFAYMHRTYAYRKGAFEEENLKYDI